MALLDELFGGLPQPMAPQAAPARRPQVAQAAAPPAVFDDSGIGGADVLGAILQGMGGIAAPLGKLVSGQGDRDRLNQSRTDVYNWLVTQKDPNDPSRTITPDMAKIIVSNEGIAKAYLPRILGTSSPTEYGLTPFYGQDAEGNTVPFVMGKDGAPKRVELGGGVTPLGPEGTASAREAGKLNAKARANLESVESIAGAMKSNIDKVMTDPNLDRMTGMIQGRLPNITGTANTLQAKIDQIQGQTFLQAYESLKGAGQITEIEGQKATAALTRLSNMAQDDAGYKEALQDAKNEIDRLVELAREKASKGMLGVESKGGDPAISGAESSAPALSKTINGVTYDKIGGQWFAR